MSCIWVFYLLLSAERIGHRWTTTDDPDALYAKRQDIASAQQAAKIWQSRLQKNPNDFESAWKLARATYWIGTQGPEAERKGTLEQGISGGPHGDKARAEQA